MDNAGELANLLMFGWYGVGFWICMDCLFRVFDLLPVTEGGAAMFAGGGGAGSLANTCIGGWPFPKSRPATAAEI